jgi:hypothetical protein
VTALLYAIADCEAADVPARTSDGQRLRAVGAGRPVAVLAADGRSTPLPGAGPDQPAAGALAHARAVSELMHAHPVLPARYGLQVEEAEVEQLLDEHRSGLLQALRRVDGAVELAVRARLPRPHADPGAQSGTAYLRDRLAEGQAVADVVGRLAPLGALAREAQNTGAERGTLRRAYLVERAEVSDFVDAVRAIDQRHPELELVCSGPWPPYSFSGGWR